MKNNIAFIVLLTISVLACKKETINITNVEKIESGTVSRLNRVQCIGSTCIVCGGERFFSAETIRSTDNGSSWQMMSHPDAGKGLYGMAISPMGDILLTGIDGKVLSSANEGNDWTFRQFTYWKFFNSIAKPQNNLIILVNTEAQHSGNIIRVDSNLNVIDTTFVKLGLNDINMVSATTGYIAGFGAVLKTTNSGQNWEYLDIKNDNFNGIHCLNEQQAWVCGYAGSLYRTNNGGTSWERLRNGNSLFNKGYAFLNVYFKDANTGWVCGEDGLLLSTTDGGDTWKEYEKFTEEAIRDITLTQDGHLITVGDKGNMYRITL